MGLDWIAGAKPKPGYEDEFLRLWPILTGDKGSYRAAFERLDEILVSPDETLNAPRIGLDPQADEWARKEFPNRTNKKLSQEEFMQKMKGIYVLELVPPCDGMPRYTIGCTSDSVDLSSFRGKLLRYCREIIGEELLEEAYHSKLPEDLARYGDALLGRAEAFAEKHGIDTTKLLERTTDNDLARMRYDLDVVFSAGRWCRFWSSHGHWLYAWF